MTEDTMADVIAVTDKAVKQIATILKDEPDGAMLRVGVDGGGCSGFQYKFAVATAPEADDIKITRDGVTVLVDPLSVDLIKGATLDFVDDLMGRSFRVENPNATASCGCGTSFSIG